MADTTKIARAVQMKVEERISVGNSPVETLRSLDSEAGAPALEIVQKRYQALVDKKYLHGLTPQEAAEMALLAEQLEEADAPFYAPILEALKQNGSS